MKRFGQGCVTLLALAAFLLIGQCVWDCWDEPRGRLPQRVRTSEIIANESSSSFTEGCFYALYRLTPGTITALRKDGLAFLGGDTVPTKNNPDNPYSPWQATPLAFEEGKKGYLAGDGATETLFALGASRGCSNFSGDEARPFLRFEAANFNAERALRQPGNFYTLTSNREGMMLLAPAAGLALVLYWG